MKKFLSTQIENGDIFVAFTETPEIALTAETFNLENSELLVTIEDDYLEIAFTKSDTFIRFRPFEICEKPDLIEISTIENINCSITPTTITYKIADENNLIIIVFDNNENSGIIPIKQLIIHTI